MRNKLFILVALISTITAINASAQATASSTGYFTDGYIGKHFLNPAFTPSYSYFAFPAINNIVISTSSNLSMNKLFFPTEKGLSLFMSPLVSTSDFMKGIREVNNLDAGANIDLLSAGFYNYEGNIFTSVSIRSTTDLRTNIAGDLFALAKGADSFSGGKDYSLSGTRLNLTSNFQLALSQSYEIGKKLHIGYSAKFLIGAALAEADFNNFNAHLGADKWDVESDATITYHGVYFAHTTDDEGNEYIDFSQPGLNSSTLIYDCFKNLGFGIDLGFTYDVLDELQVSASILDLGAIFYRDVTTGTSTAHSTYGESGSAESLEEFGKQLSGIVQFREDEAKTKKTNALPTTIRVGAQYRMPFHEQLSAGGLFTYQICKGYDRFEFRPSVNYDATRWLGLGLSYGINQPLVTIPFVNHMLGFIANIHCKGINFFVCADNIPLSYSPQGIPIRTASTTVATGLCINFGEYYGRYHRIK